MNNEERFKEIYRTQIARTGAPELLAWLESTDFFTAPASTRFHGAYPGGLVDHSLNVYFALIDGPYVKNYTMETRAICAHDAARGGSYSLSAAMERTPLVLALHTADMTATQEEKAREEP